METYLIINEAHTLLPDQVRELREKGFDNYEEIRIPKEGWDARTRLSLAHEWAGRGGRYIFVSPEPVILGRMAYFAVFRKDVAVYVFSNDRRVKKELPDGWRLVELGRGDAWG